VRLVVGGEPRESWDQLSVEYAVPWPLHLLITPAAIANYNKVTNIQCWCPKLLFVDMDILFITTCTGH
jgi:hypothetical protein